MVKTLYWEDVKDGQELPPLKKNVSTQQMVKYAGASLDFYQIHYDKDFAQSTGLKGLIVHGALKNAFLGQLLHDWAGDSGRIKSYGCSYRGMDYVGQDIVCRGVVTKKYQDGDEHLVELDIWTETGKSDDDGRPKNEEGIKTTPGTAVVILPSR